MFSYFYFYSTWELKILRMDREFKTSGVEFGRREGEKKHRRKTGRMYINVIYLYCLTTIQIASEMCNYYDLFWMLFFFVRLPWKIGYPFDYLWTIQGMNTPSSFLLASRSSVPIPSFSCWQKITSEEAAVEKGLWGEGGWRWRLGWKIW